MLTASRLNYRQGNHHHYGCPTMKANAVAVAANSPSPASVDQVLVLVCGYHGIVIKLKNNL